MSAQDPGTDAAVLFPAKRHLSIVVFVLVSAVLGVATYSSDRDFTKAAWVGFGFGGFVAVNVV